MQKSKSTSSSSIRSCSVNNSTTINNEHNAHFHQSVYLCLNSMHGIFCDAAQQQYKRHNKRGSTETKLWDDNIKLSIIRTATTWNTPHYDNYAKSAVFLPWSGSKNKVKQLLLLYILNNDIQATLITTVTGNVHRIRCINKDAVSVCQQAVSKPSKKIAQYTAIFISKWKNGAFRHSQVDSNKDT